jgi:hypothetical protein
MNVLRSGKDISVFMPSPLTSVLTIYLVVATRFAHLSPSWSVLKQFHNGAAHSSAKHGDFDNNDWRGLEEQA